ncbi:uracil-DNA glycosylase family protein [Vulcaniibacterium tengchongense]|uniref:Type-4 uracil-DNA glycosylase n=1 Tax=Vulcaniibacterium tengchongense TaxID=1273429 RepID=A0A3N4W703_9GAMM|nr:uracil-DNA glycosylase family protein [Vulcaniibacterium tengchongense]
MRIIRAEPQRRSRLATRRPAKKAAKRVRKRVVVAEGEAPVPEDDSLAALRAAAAGCRRCPLWKPATQTVFGEGPEDARVLFVGEQPGDAEDLAGRPFVGPAGRVFDRALAELGLERARFYVTNAVKHFKFERRGRVRLHRSPDPSERAACRIWLERELATVRPDIVVCLGAIAARAVFGNKFRLMQQRGTWQTLPDGTRAFATVHPSWVLRQRGDEARREAYAHFVDDLSLLLKVRPE